MYDMKSKVATEFISDEEIKETLRIASQLAELNIAANVMRQAFEQTKLAMTTSITIKKEGDHE